MTSALRNQDRDPPKTCNSALAWFHGSALDFTQIETENVVSGHVI